MVHTVFRPDVQPTHGATTVGLDLRGMGLLELLDGSGTRYLAYGSAGAEFADGTFVGTYAFRPGIASVDLDLFVRGAYGSFELRRTPRSGEVRTTE